MPQHPKEWYDFGREIATAPHQIDAYNAAEDGPQRERIASDANQLTRDSWRRSRAS